MSDDDETDSLLPSHCQLLTTVRGGPHPGGEGLQHLLPSGHVSLSQVTFKDPFSPILEIRFEKSEYSLLSLMKCQHQVELATLGMAQ